MKAIPPSAYYQLLGLRLLADRHNAALEQITLAARALTGEEDEHGHTLDFVHGSRELDELLGLLGIEVSDGG